MAISAEQLNVILSARDREFTRAMDRAQRRVERFSKQTNRGLGTSRQAFTALAGAARTFLPALSAGLVVQQVRRVVSELDNIGKTADRLGLTTDALQEMRVAAESAGVSTQTFDMAMQRFGRRLAEARQGAGEAKGAFEEMGIELLNSDGTARSIESVLNEVADAMGGMSDQTDRNRIAMRLFDSEGVALVNMLRDGSAGLEQMRQRARDLGIVLDENLIRNAEETQQQLDLMTRVINADLSEALVNLAPLLVATANGIAAIARTVNYMFSAMPIEDRMTQRLEEIQTQTQQINAAILEAEDGVISDLELNMGPSITDVASAVLQLEALEAEARGLNDALEQLGQNDDNPPALDPVVIQNATDGVRSARDAYIELMEAALEANPALEAVGFTAESLGETMKMVESGMENAFMSMIDGTMTAKEAFRSMAADIIRQLYRVLVVQRMVGSIGGGGIAGAIGDFFGMTPTGAASGRPVQAGQPYTVGEHGRELFVPQSAGRVLSVSQAQNAVGGGGGVVVNQTINVSTGVQQTVRTEIKQLMPQIAESAKSAVVDAKRRGGSYGRAFS